MRSKWHIGTNDRHKCPHCELDKGHTAWCRNATADDFSFTIPRRKRKSKENDDRI